MAESTPAPKPPRAPTVAHGFDIMLGTADDVAKAGELGAFAGLKTKSELEKEFTAWIAAQPANLVADFLAHLKRRAQERLDGMGVGFGRTTPTSDPPLYQAPAADPRTPDGGIPLVGKDKLDMTD